MIHEVKSWTEHFDAITSGVKYFELRKNDRGYKVGDTVVLQEFRQHIGTYSGREQKIIITYMVDGG